MSSIKKLIGGEECECFEFSDPVYGDSRKMRMLLEGTFGVDFNRESIILVPLFLSESELDAIGDLWITEQEKELGLPLGESCTSSGWWVGSSDVSKDMDITDKYDFLIPFVLANHDSQCRLQCEIDSLYLAQEKIGKKLKKEYENGESAWASQLEVKMDDLERLISEHEDLLKQSMALTAKLPLSYQIQSASARAVETSLKNSVNIKELCDAYNRSDLEAFLYLKEFCTGCDRSVIEDLIHANLNFYEEGYSENTSIRDESEYHDKKWVFLTKFGVMRDVNDQMIPVIGNSPINEVSSDR